MQAVGVPIAKIRQGPHHVTREPALVPHAYRRTFSTIAIESAILEEIVGRLLNHTPLSITGQRYVRPSLDALRPAMQMTCVEIERRLKAR